jgi:hypothetical protein
MGVSVVTYAADALIAATGVPGLTTPRLDLITAITAGPSKITAWADLTIAAFTGYAGPITVTFSAVYISHPTGLLSVDVSDAIFNGPSAGSGVQAIGWVLHDTTGTPVVYAVGLFDGPLGLEAALDRINVDETLGLGTQASYQVSN